MDAAGSSGADGGELAAGEAALGTISSRRGGGVGAWERGAGLEPGEAEESGADSVGTDREEVGGEPGERFGPTLAVEHLAKDDGIAPRVETLRKWMLEGGLWSRERTRPAHGRKPGLVG